MPTKKPAARDRQTGRNSARSAGKKGAGSNAGESSPRMQVERLLIADLHYDPANVRKHGERNLQIIRSSLARFGQQRPILVDATNVVRAGNGTLQAARELGWGSILCVRTDLTGSEAIAYAIADNRSAELAEWEDGLLGQQLQGLLDDGIDLDAVGFSEDEIDALVKELADDGGMGSEGDEAPEPELDKAEELLEKWKVKTGQLWLIPSVKTPGKNHRLLCGDSTKKADVEKVMGGEKADLCFTSPPYNQQRDYEGGIGDWLTLMQGVFANLPMTQTGQVLVNLGLIHRDGEWIPYWDPWIEWMRAQGWRRFGWYVWDQGWGLPGDWNGRCAPSHEFLFHFNRQAVTPNYILEKNEENIGRRGGCTFRDKDGSLKEFTNPDACNNTHKIPDSVWRINRAVTAGKLESAHPAVFSVGLPSFCLSAYSQPGNTTFDPFCGSGTTIVAAEQLGRLACAVELAPKYVAVILERLSQMGLTPKLQAVE